MRHEHPPDPMPVSDSAGIDIVATLGPATAAPDRIRELLAAGATRFRLNLAHADADWLNRCLAAIRSIVRPESARLPVVADLPGRKFRTGRLDRPFRLETGQEIFFGRPSPARGSERQISCPHWPENHPPEKGEIILLQDGALELRVLDAGPDGCRAQVTRGGTVLDRMGVVFAGTASLQFMALEKEKIRLCLHHGVAQFLISYCDSPADITAVRRNLNPAPSSECTLIPKLETAIALENMDALLSAVSTVCLARGDLGAQVGLLRVPPAEIRLLAAARRTGRSVWIAGQLLPGSLTERGVSRPELAAVYYALCHGARGFILSEETAIHTDAPSAVRALTGIVRQWTVAGAPRCTATGN